VARLLFVVVVVVVCSRQSTHRTRLAMLIGVLECEDLELWRSKGGHAAFFERALRLAPAAADATAERWVKFEVTRGQLPDADDLRRFDAFIITGSHHSAYGSEGVAWRGVACRSSCVTDGALSLSQTTRCHGARRSSRSFASLWLRPSSTRPSSLALASGVRSSLKVRRTPSRRCH